MGGDCAFFELYDEHQGWTVWAREVVSRLDTSIQTPRKVSTDIEQAYGRLEELIEERRTEYGLPSDAAILPGIDVNLGSPSQVESQWMTLVEQVEAECRRLRDRQGTGTASDGGTTTTRGTGSIVDRVIVDLREQYGIPDDPSLLADLDIDLGFPTQRMSFRVFLMLLVLWLDEEGIRGPDQCPHTAEADSDLCVFHAPEGTAGRSESASQQFKQVIHDSGGEGAELNYFVGAQLDRLDLRYEVLDSDTDSRPIQLKFASVDELLLDHAEIRQPIEMEGATIGRASFDQAVVHRDASFKGTTFGRDTGAECCLSWEGADVTRGKLDFQKARFLEAVTFEGSTFDGREITFRKARFEGASGVDEQTSADFSHAVWGGWQATFKRAEFQGDVRFDASTFSNDETVFEDVEFGAGAADAPSLTRIGFEAVTFEGGSTDFDGAVFNGRAQFDDAEFNNGAAFTDADFVGRASFEDLRVDGRTLDCSGSMFRGETVFKRSEFGRGAEFEGCLFVGVAAFEGARFRHRMTDFSRCRFDSEARFHGVEFDGSADFQSTTFVGEAAFGPGTPDDEASFGAARFGERQARFDAVRFLESPAFSEVRFENGVSFEGARFYSREPTPADFELLEVPSGRANFDEVTFHHGATFDRSQFHGRRLTFDGSRFRDDGRTALSFEGAELNCRWFSCGGPHEGSDEPSDAADPRAGSTQGETTAVQEVPFLGRRVSFDRTTFRDMVVDLGGVEFRYPRSASGASQREGSGVSFHETAVREGWLDLRRVRSRTETYALTAKGEAYLEHRPPEYWLHVAMDGGSPDGLGVTLPESVPGDSPNSEDMVAVRDRVVEHYPEAIQDSVDSYKTLQRSLIRENRIRFTFEADIPKLPNDLSKATKLELRVERPPDEPWPVEEALRAVSDGRVDDVATGTLARLVARGLVERTVTEEPLPERALAQSRLGRLRRYVDRIRPSNGTEGSGDQRRVIDMQGAVVEAGAITQPPGDRDYTLYDLTEASVGDVRFRPQATPDVADPTDTTRSGNGTDTDIEADPVFDYLKFAKTTFADFDFGKHHRTLRRNDWNIHQLQGHEDRLNPVEREDTYLKAKNAASDAGANEAAAQFFQKELRHRRAKHRENVRERFLDTGSRFGGWLVPAYSAVANLLMDSTSGYGEQPGRVILSALLVIAAFVAIFEAAWRVNPAEGAREESGTIIDSVILSAESFTTLVLGGSQVSERLVQFLAYAEGFIGAFLIALFVFTLTRSIHR